MQETQVPSLGWEDPLGEGHGNPLQCSCLKNPLARGAWWAAVHGSQRVGHDRVTNDEVLLVEYLPGVRWDGQHPRSQPGLPAVRSLFLALSWNLLFS